MWTVHLEESSVTTFMGITSGPGLIIPETFLPSQFITIVTWLRCVGVGPQSPDHVPTRGCPSCAKVEPIRADATTSKRKRFLNITALSCCCDRHFPRSRPSWLRPDCHP